MHWDTLKQWNQGRKVNKRQEKKLKIWNTKKKDKILNWSKNNKSEWDYIKCREMDQGLPNYPHWNLEIQEQSATSTSDKRYEEIIVQLKRNRKFGNWMIIMTWTEMKHAKFILIEILKSENRSKRMYRWRDWLNKMLNKEEKILK